MWLVESCVTPLLQAALKAYLGAEQQCAQAQEVGACSWSCECMLSLS